MKAITLVFATVLSLFSWIPAQDLRAPAADPAGDTSGWHSSSGLPLQELREILSKWPRGSGAGPVDATAPGLSAGRSVATARPQLAAPSARSFAVDPTPIIGGNVADALTPEIKSMARGLQYDPLKIFNFVRNHVDTDWYYGCKKGAHLTLMEMSGNDYDQCALLAALLRASGIDASYFAAPVNFSYEYLSASTGITNPYSHLNDTDFAALITTPTAPVSASDPDLPNKRKEYGIGGFLIDRGYPIMARVDEGGLSFSISQVWVRFSADGQTYNLSPSIKEYASAPEIDLTPAGMTKAALVAAAAGTVNPGDGKKWVKNLNYGNLSALLSSYTNQVIAKVAGSYDALEMDDILARRKIVPIDFAALDEPPQIVAASTPWSALETWSGAMIPDAKMSTLTISAAEYAIGDQLPIINNQNPYKRVYMMPELADRKLSLNFSGSTGTTAKFCLEDVQEGASYRLFFGNSITVKMEAKHPHYRYALDSNGQYVVIDAARHNVANLQEYTNGRSGFSPGDESTLNCYAFPYAFENPRKVLRKRQAILEKLRKDVAATDVRLRTESLNVIGLDWYDQTWRHSLFSSSHYEVLSMYHHRVGRVAQERGFYIDIGNQLVSANHRHSDEGAGNDFTAVESMMHSAMEHAVLDQSTGRPAGVSTVAMIYQANLAGEEIYRMTSDTWDAEKSALSNYPAKESSFLETQFDLPNTVGLLPKTGNRLVNSWRGAGYMVKTEKQLHLMRISGLLNGGYSSIAGYLNANPMVQYLWSDSAYITSAFNPLAVAYNPVTTPRQVSWDPVDLFSGGFILDRTELSLGRLSFSRHYNSNARNQSTAGLGNGWTHDHDIRVAERSSTLAALGETNAYQAAALYVSSLAAKLVYDNGNAKDWATASLITHWAAGMTVNNAVGVTFGNKTIEFIRMPDGTFVPPPGMNYTLSKTGGTAATATTDAVIGIYTLTERNGNSYLFNNKGRISKITDPNGNTQTFNYNASDQLATVVDSFGHTLTYGWDAGKIKTVSDGTGRDIGLVYDSDNLISFTDVEGKTWTYEYDSSNRMISQKDPDHRTMIENDYDFGNRVIRQRSQGLAANQWHYGWSGFLNLEQDPQGGITGYHYDEKGRSVGVSNALGHTTWMAFDGQDRVVVAADARNERITRTWNADNNLVAETDPQGYVMQYFYDAQKRVSQVIDKRGKSTLLAWTAGHQLESSTDALGNIVSQTYYPNGKLHTIKDGENKVTTYDYESTGFLKKATYHDGAFTSILNSNRGEALETTDEEGRVTKNTYNKRGQLLSSTLPAIPGEPVAVTTLAYDSSGNLQTSTDAKGNSTSYTFNALANPLTVTQPALAAGNNTVATSYDDRDWPVGTINSLGHTSSLGYDPAKRLNLQIDALNRRVEISHDENGNVIETKDALNQITRQGYNSRHENEQVTDAMTRNTELRFDANGNQQTLTNRRGKTYTFAYDDANRLTSLITPGSKTTATAYYKNNLVKTITEPSGQSTHLTYDNRNFVQSKTDPTGAVSYAYDKSGRLKTVTEGGATLARTYDERGQLKTYTNADGELIQYRYDEIGNLKRLTYPDGKEVNYTYNARNLLESVTDWRNKTTTYTYDRLGRLIGTSRPNGTANVILRDAAGQILNVKESANGSLISYLNFHYDKAGQIKQRFRAPTINASWTHPDVEATYDDDNRLLTFNGQSVANDPDGNLTAGPIRKDSGIVNLSYNSRNQLLSAGGISYTYDAEGNRRSASDAAGITRYTIDPGSQLSRLLVKHNPDGSATRYVYGLGLLYEVDDAGNSKTHHYDQVGSTILRTDDNGIVIGRAEYSAYGLTTLKIGDLDTPFLFNGRAGVMTDANGLLNMRARYYSPYLMRFLNADPSGFSGGPNWFAYADGNPISLSDPFGLCAQSSDKGFWGNTVDFLHDLDDSLGRTVIGEFSRTVNQTVHNIMNYPNTPDDNLVLFDMGAAGWFTPVGEVGALAGASKAANATVRAESSLSGQLLRQDLLRQEAASAFNVAGGLSQVALAGSREIIPASKLLNPAIPNGFSKFSTETFRSPSGPFQVHFYQNSQTSEIFTGLDYKAVFNNP